MRVSANERMEIFKDTHFTLRDLLINGIKSDLSISNPARGNELDLRFSTKNHPSYELTVNKKGLKFARYISLPNPNYRPNKTDDHGYEEPMRLTNIETLLIVTDSTKVEDKKEGDLIWENIQSPPYKKEGCEVFYVPIFNEK